MTGTMSTDLERGQAAERWAWWRACQFAWLTLASYWVIASLSINTEMVRAGGVADPALSWVTEGSSVIVTALMVPGIMWMGLRAPFEPGRWLNSLPLHILAFLAYSAAHILVMVVLRKTIWAFAYDSYYEFSNGFLLREVIYEGRKDLGIYIGYQIMISAALAFQNARLEVEAARAEAQRSHRLTLKCGGRVMRIEADQVLTAKAAGNYVEVRTQAGEHLARSTLAELEKQFAAAGIDAVRVHRSWLVNRAAIAEIAPTGEGDVILTLTNGERIPGSRRYRDRLEAA